jgi:hypothetical protein
MGPASTGKLGPQTAPAGPDGSLAGATNSMEEYRAQFPDLFREHR